jgi:hypothetical protein
LVYFSCFFNQVCFLFVVQYQRKLFYVGGIWGNLISYLVLKPIELETNGTTTNPVGKYDKCGADFSEQEYKGAEVVNRIDRKTVQQNK